MECKFSTGQGCWHRHGGLQLSRGGRPSHCHSQWVRGLKSPREWLRRRGPTVDGRNPVPVDQGLYIPGAGCLPSTVWEKLRKARKAGGTFLKTSSGDFPCELLWLIHSSRGGNQSPGCLRLFPLPIQVQMLVLLIFWMNPLFRFFPLLFRIFFLHQSADLKKLEQVFLGWRHNYGGCLG